MTQKRWQDKQTKKRDLKYIGYTVGYNTFTWDNVIRITQVYIDAQYPRNIVAYYEIHFTHGKHITIIESLETRTEVVKSFFWGKIDKPLIDAQLYFNEPCKLLTDIMQSRKKATEAYFDFKRYTLKK